MNTGDDLPHFKGFCDIVIGPQLQAGDLVKGFSLGGEHDHRGFGNGPDILDHLPAVHLGHHHIQKHQIRMDALEGPQAFGSVGGTFHSVAFLLQIQAEKFSDISIVFDDQQCFCHKKGSFPAAGCSSGDKLGEGIKRTSRKSGRVALSLDFIIMCIPFDCINKM